MKIKSSPISQVKLSYEYEVKGEQEKKELPFVMGVLGDFSGKGGKLLPVLKDRSFMEVLPQRFSSLMARIRPQVAFAVPNHLTSNQEKLEISLTFRSMSDFHPVEVLHHVLELQKFYQDCQYLQKLKKRLDRSPRLAHVLSVFVDNIKEWEGCSDEEWEEVYQDILEEGKMEWRPEHIEEALESIRVFKIELLANRFIAGNTCSQQIAIYRHQAQQKIEQQLNEIIHHSDFLQLESSWRGLFYLSQQKTWNSMNKLKVLPLSKAEMLSDFGRGVHFDQTFLFQKIFEAEFGTFGGEPYTTLVVDYFFSHLPRDLFLLKTLAKIASSAHVPLITAPDPRLFDLEDFTALGEPRDWSRNLTRSELTEWHEFRKDEDTRYLTMVLPRILLRLRYDPFDCLDQGFYFVEKPRNLKEFVWGNAAYALAVRIAHSYIDYGWGGKILGAEQGGRVGGFACPDAPDGLIGDKGMFMEVSLSDGRERELSEFGLMSLLHAHGKEHAVFWRDPTLHFSFQQEQNVENRLSTLLAISQIVHYLKATLRSQIGTFANRRDVEQSLNRWLAQYISLGDWGEYRNQGRYPLLEGKVEVTKSPNQVGSYQVAISLKPRLIGEAVEVALKTNFSFSPSTIS